MTPELDGESLNTFRKDMVQCHKCSQNAQGGWGMGSYLPISRKKWRYKGKPFKLCCIGMV